MNYSALHTKVKGVCYRMGIPQDAEDFTQEILLMRLEGLREKQSVFQGVVDAIRRDGRSTRRGRNVKLVELSEKLPAPQRDLDARDEVDVRLSRIDKMYRAFFVLYYLWGMTHEEIGFCFGMKGNAVAQRMQKVWGKLE